MKDDKRFFEAKTTENTQVWIRKSDVSGVEVIPGTVRSETYLKLYIAGYSFALRMDMDELIQVLREDSQ